MPAKKVSHSLHMRINELLDQLLEKESKNKALNQKQPELNLGRSDQPLFVSMESFFDFNFELSADLNRWIDDINEESMLDSHQREWEFFEFRKGDRLAGTNYDSGDAELPKQPR